MLTYWPSTSGIWSNLSNWLTAAGETAGRLPSFNDTVHADGKIIYIDQDINVNLLTTTVREGGLLSGGEFRPNANTIIRANLLAGHTTVLNFISAFPNTCTIYGDITGSIRNTPTGGIYAIRNSSTGTINVTSNYVRCVNNQILSNDSTGTCNIYFPYFIGVDSGAGTPNTPSIRNSSGTLFVSGNLYPSTGSYNDLAGYLGLVGSGTIYFSGYVIGGQNTCKGIYHGGSGSIYAEGFFEGGPNASANRTAAIEVRSSGYLSVSGILQGGRTVNASSALAIQSGNPIIDVVGTAIGGSPGSGIQNDGGGPIITIRGDVIGSNINGSTASGVRMRSNAVNVTVFGNVSGGSGSATARGLFNEFSGTATINGSVIGDIANGVSNNASGIVYIKKVIGGRGGPLSPTLGTAAGLSNSQNGLAYVEEIEFGAQGASPVSGPVFLLNIPNTVLVMRGEPLAFTPTTLFGNLNVPNLFPAASSVREGVVYGNGDFTGTMIVPPKDAVQVGVPVGAPGEDGIEDPRGTFVLSPESFWTFSRSNSALNDPKTIGYRIKNLATIASVGQQLGSFNMYPPMSAWSNLNG